MVSLSSNVRLMHFPEELRYSSDHEWVRDENSNRRVGITDYAQDALGDIVFIELPKLGAIVEPGQAIAEVESTKSVSDVYSPVAGTVVEVNDALKDAPQLLNEDPYGQGWIFLIDPQGAEEASLLDVEAYRALIEE